MANAVLVVDMVRGFLEPGHNLYCGDDSRSIIEPVRQMLRRESEAGAAILFISDHHLPDDLEFQMFPVHCLIGTEEPDVIPELHEWVTESNVVPKNRYSGFFNTDLEDRLAALNPDKVIICGVCTDICVMHTTSDARNRDYAVEIRRTAWRPSTAMLTVGPWATSPVSWARRWCNPRAALAACVIIRPLWPPRIPARPEVPHAVPALPLLPMGRHPSRFSTSTPAS